MNYFVPQCSFCTDQREELFGFIEKTRIDCGDAVVQFDERGQFYFLCSTNSNLQQRYSDNGWLIVYSHPFNKDLTIGSGLHEHTFVAGYLHTFDDKDKVKMWNDIIDFAFRSDFHQLFFPLENYFKSFLKLDGGLCFYLYDYVPVSRNIKATTELKKITNLLFRFKEGHALSLSVKLFSMAMSRIYAITNKKENSILIPIPASTRVKHNQRFSTFCYLLSERTGIPNGFNAITIRNDRDELKGLQGVDKIFNLTFNETVFKGKKVILVDDVLNTGQGFIQLRKKLLEHGAKSVMGIFLVKTVPATEMSVI